MDPDSLMLTGYQQYHLNLTKANGIMTIKLNTVGRVLIVSIY